MTTSSELRDPHEALAALLPLIAAVETETMPLAKAAGRVLAAPAFLDRPSPPCDVSAMDGYVLGAELVAAGLQRFRIAGDVMIGRTPPALLRDAALRIFTGSPVPQGGVVVVPKEHVREQDGCGEFIDQPDLRPGNHIRRRGENAPASAQIVEGGVPITPGVAAALASIGATDVTVHRRVGVGLLATGDELVDPSERRELAPWEIRNSNAASLAALLARLPWVQVEAPRHVPDDPARLDATLAELLECCDAVLTSGGVSVGAHDHVPDAVRRLGGRVVFHRLRVRPGKPLLGAIGKAGQVIFGLPGNPVSAAVMTRRFVVPALRRRAGFSRSEAPAPIVSLNRDAAKALDLWWYRLARLRGPGEAELVSLQSSGDIAGLASSDGFIEVPPSRTERGPWPYYGWENDCAC